MKKIKERGLFYSGISGLQLPVPKYLFPPEHQDSSRLTYYSTFFNSIEFNSTFYKVPLSKTITRWGESVNENFRFTFKLWKEITHQKDFEYKETDIDAYLNSVAYIDNKKGCLLIQLPPKIGKEYLYKLYHLLNFIKEHETGKLWNIAVEFRNRSWYHEDVYTLLNLYKATMVIHDKSNSNAPMNVLNSSFLYIRFHGPSGNYRGSYDDDFLNEYAGYMKEWMSEGKTVYTYFNNTMGEAFNNLMSLNKMVKLK
jgi:uncharacterized protein YecE (DUF72 family)